MNTEIVQDTLTDTRDCFHPECVVCSSANIKGLHMEFDVNDDGSVQTTFQCDKSVEGYPGMVHGGIISLILDGAMGNCMFARGLTTVTVEMTTRFRSPLVIEEQAKVLARVTRSSHPLYLLEAEIIQNGKIKATSKGKYYDQPKLINLF